MHTLRYLNTLKGTESVQCIDHLQNQCSPKTNVNSASQNIQFKKKQLGKKVKLLSFSRLLRRIIAQKKCALKKFFYWHICNENKQRIQPAITTQMPMQVHLFFTFLPIRLAFERIQYLSVANRQPLSPLGILSQKKQHNSRNLSKSNKSKSSSRTNSIGIKKHSDLNYKSVQSDIQSANISKGFCRDSRYSVFTTIERSNKVVLSETPISGRILNEQLCESKDLQQFLSSCNQNGYENTVFEFDSVFSELQKQEKFYSATVKPIVQGFIESENGSVIAFGPSSSGKTYTLHGKTGAQRGVIPRAVEDILAIIKASSDQSINQSSQIEEFGSMSNPIVSVNNRRYATRENALVTVHTKGAGDPDMMNERVFLRMSVYMIYCDRIYDLLGKSHKKVKLEQYIDKQSQEVVSRFVNLSEKLILSVDQYYSAMNEAFKERRTLSVKLQDHDIRKRSHLVVSFSIVQQHTFQNSYTQNSLNELSRLNFVELSGSEQSVASSGQSRDTSVRQFVTKSFNCLSTQLLKSALGQRTQFEEGDSSLVSCIKSTLTQKSTILVLECASPNQQFFDHTLPAAKFCARIRETIIRKLQKFMLIKQSQIQNNGKQNLRIKTATKQNSRESTLKTTTFGAPSSELKESLQSARSVRLRENPRAIIEQLESEIQIFNAQTIDQLNSSKNLAEINSIRQWCQHSIELVNKTLFYIDQIKRFELKVEEKQNLVDQLSQIKSQIQDIELKVINPRTSLSPRITNQGMESPAVFHTRNITMDFKPVNQALNLGNQTERHRETRRDPFNQVVVSSRSSNLKSTKNQEISPQTQRDDIIDLETQTRHNQYKTFDNKKQAVSNIGFYTERAGKNLLISDCKTSKRDVQSKLTDAQYFSVRDRTRSSQNRSSPQSASGHTFTPLTALSIQEQMTLEQKKEAYQEENRKENQYQPSSRHNSSRKQLLAQPLPTAIQTYQNQSARSGRDTSPSFRNKESEDVDITSYSQSTKNFNHPLQIHPKPSYVRHDQIPNFEKVQNLPQLMEIREKFISSQKIHKIVQQAFGDPNQPQSLYRSCEETLQDINRLVMLQDFEGLKRRVMQLFKENQSANEVIQARDAEIVELQEQLEARDKAINEVETINNKNLDEYIRSMQDLKSEKEMSQTQTSMHMKNLQENIDYQTKQLEDLKRQKASQDQKLDQYVNELESTRRSNFDYETKQAQIMEENKKMHSNYEILKEHELNIIKDFQEKKITDLRDLNEQINALRKVIQEKDEKIREGERKAAEFEDQIRRKEFENERMVDQKKILDQNYQMIQSQSNQLQKDKEQQSQQIETLQQKKNEVIDQRDAEIKAKKAALDEIGQLQDLIGDMEQTIQTLNQDLKTQQEMNERKGGVIDQLNMQKKVFDERMELKDKEIKSIQDRERILTDQVAQLEKQYELLERQHIKIKAQEYDKVDVLRVNAELEGRLSHLQSDIEQVVKDRNTKQQKLQETMNENEQLKEQIRVQTTEQEYFRRINEQQLEKFEKKFSEFHQELNFLNDENIRHKEKEKKQKKFINELEVEIFALKEKNKYVEEKNRDLQNKLEGVQRDMTQIVHENEKQVMYSMITEQKGQQKEAKNEEAVFDYQTIMKNFKRERIGQKENLAVNYGSSFGATQRSARFDEGSQSPQETDRAKGILPRLQRSIEPIEFNYKFK